MDSHGYVLSLPGGDQLRIGMPIALARAVSDGDEERLKRPFSVLEVSVVESGFHFLLAKDSGEPWRKLTYEPAHFKMFVSDLQRACVPFDALSRMGTDGAIVLLRTFDEWAKGIQAKLYRREIEAGKMTFDDARNSFPAVFEVQEFQDFFAKCFVSGNMPKGKKGRRRTPDARVGELYALASKIYRDTPNLSFEAACASAVERRPDLVPQGWQSDPDGNLKREAARYWDKSRFSQQSYRERRDG